jgi:hypothetical protein
MPAKKGTVVPKKGTVVHRPNRCSLRNRDCRRFAKRDRYDAPGRQINDALDRRQRADGEILVCWFQRTERPPRVVRTRFWSYFCSGLGAGITRECADSSMRTRNSRPW